MDTGFPRGSGDDVGRQIIFDHRDLVLEAQLALLETGDLQLILAVGRAERGYRRIEIAMLDPQARQPLAHLLFGHPTTIPISKAPSDAGPFFAPVGRRIARQGRFAAAGV